MPPKSPYVENITGGHYRTELFGMSNRLICLLFDVFPHVFNLVNGLGVF